MLDFSKIEKYASKLTSLSMSQMLYIAKAWGYDAFTEVAGLPDDDRGGTVMGKQLYIARRSKCDECVLHTRSGWCDPSNRRPHASDKHSDGSPVIVEGCGCRLSAKQKQINEHCPAGEW